MSRYYGKKPVTDPVVLVPVDTPVDDGEDNDVIVDDGENEPEDEDEDYDDGWVNTPDEDEEPEDDS